MCIKQDPLQITSPHLTREEFLGSINGRHQAERIFVHIYKENMGKRREARYKADDTSEFLQS